MRLEIEIDYEPDEHEAAQIRGARTDLERVLIVQDWLGLSGSVELTVSVIEREGPS